MPRARFTVRWMMLVVAVVGIVIGGETVRRRRASCLEDARLFASIERIALKGRAAKLREAESYRGRANRARRSAQASLSLEIEFREFLDAWSVDGEAEFGVFLARMMQDRLYRLREMRWLDSEADFCNRQAEIMRDQAGSFGQLARDRARAAEAAGHSIDLMMLLGVSMILLASGFHLVPILWTKRRRRLAVATG